MISGSTFDNSMPWSRHSFFISSATTSALTRSVGRCTEADVRDRVEQPPVDGCLLAQHLDRPLLQRPLRRGLAPVSASTEPHAWVVVSTKRRVGKRDCCRRPRWLEMPRGHDLQEHAHNIAGGFSVFSNSKQRARVLLRNLTAAPRRGPSFRSAWQLSTARNRTPQSCCCRRAIWR